MEWLFAGLIVAPALFLALVRSSWLLDYVVFVLAFNRGIRRVVDYYCNGAFNPFSPISLTPLIVAGLLLIPAMTSARRLSVRAARPFAMFGGAVAIGLAVGLVLNRAAAIYSLGEWGAGLAAMLFAATQRASSREADRWIKSTGWAAVGVAAYGWWQYYTIPPWDAMWLVQSGMQGYMGVPEPTKMTMFSTLNERGPCATFLAWAVIPMIINARWRNAGGWLTVALLLSVSLLTETRSNLIIIGIVALVYPALSRGQGIGRLLVLAALIVAAATTGMDYIPGLKNMADRFESKSLYGEGSSLDGREENYLRGARELMRKPLGLGLGSSGMGSRAEGNMTNTIGDSGYLQILAQFGVLGAIFFFGALWLLWRELERRWQCGSKFLGATHIDAFIPATRAILVGSMIFLFVYDIFAGFSLLWVFLGRALSEHGDTILLSKRHKLLVRQVTLRQEILPKATSL